MKKLLQLIFGDVRNILSVGLAIVLAYVAQVWTPAASGWALVSVVIAAGFWRAI